MSEENTRAALPEYAEWRGVRFKLRLRQDYEPNETYVHFCAESDGSLDLDVSGIYDPSDGIWTWWVSTLGSGGGKTFSDAMDGWHMARLEAGDQARLIEESACPPTKRTGEV